MLLGAIVSSTDAAAVFSILRTRSIGLKGGLRPLLELESGSNDPMAYFLTIAMIQFVQMPDASVWSLVPLFFKQMLLGAVIGLIMGFIMIQLMNRIRLEIEGLYTVLLMSLAFFTFSVTDFVGGNGFLAIYLAAVVLGNRAFVHKKTLIQYFDGLAWLMQIVMFLTLGLLVYPSKILPIAGTGLLIALFLMFVARPLAVYLSLPFFHLRRKERVFISWVGLRGAVPIVFATYPLLAGLAKADEIFHLVFFISVSSVLLQGTTLALFANFLGLTVPATKKRRFALDLELTDQAKNVLVDFQIGEENPVIGKEIMALELPKTVLIVLIQRNGKFITPNGATRLLGGDQLKLMADHEISLESAYQKLGK
jgi:cell volume regulation protein A